jgi:hypothetical protein
MRAICLTHLILYGLVSLTILGTEYELWNLLPCNFLQSSVSSCLMDPNILFITLLPNTRSTTHEFLQAIMYIPRVVSGEEHSPTAAHACRKRQLKWVLGAWGYNWDTQSPGDINMETWSSRLGVGREADDPTPEKVNN